MNGIEQIRESRLDGYWGSPIDGYECLEAERHVDYLLARVDWLHAKIERLEREAAAGRVLFDKVSEVSNMGYNRFYRTPMYLEQNMTLEEWEVLTIDAALDVYTKATEAAPDAGGNEGRE